MTTSQDLLDLVYAALTDTPMTTDAGQRVFKPGDWPTQQCQYPIIRLRLASENRTSLGRNAVVFTTVATIQIIGEVSADAEEGNAGAGAAEAALWSLKRQIEVAVVNSYPLTSEIQQFPTINSQLGFDSTGATHLATLLISLALEFPEGPENFDPIEAVPLTSAGVAINTFPDAGIDLSLPQ